MVKDHSEWEEVNPGGGMAEKEEINQCGGWQGCWCERGRAQMVETAATEWAEEEERRNG